MGIQRISETERNTPLAQAVSLNGKGKDFPQIGKGKITFGNKPSQVWPWKATNVDPLGHLETESDFVNRAAKMRKTKIKLALEWFKGARAEEEEQQEEEEDDRD